MFTSDPGCTSSPSMMFMILTSDSLPYDLGSLSISNCSSFCLAWTLDSGLVASFFTFHFKYQCHHWYKTMNNLCPGVSVFLSTSVRWTLVLLPNSGTSISLHVFMFQDLFLFIPIYCILLQYWSVITYDATGLHLRRMICSVCVCSILVL